MNSRIASNNLEMLQLHRLPGRINAQQTAVLLGFQVHDVPVLVAAKLLVPLGGPSKVAPKWFSSAEVELLRQNTRFLAKATRAVSQRWRNRNARIQSDES